MTPPTFPSSRPPLIGLGLEESQAYALLQCYSVLDVSTLTTIAQQQLTAADSLATSLQKATSLEVIGKAAYLRDSASIAYDLCNYLSDAFTSRD